MAGPSWLADVLAVIMIVTAVYCASRLVIAATRRRATERDVDLVHVMMGVAMAGMLVTRINPVWSSGWAVVFGAAAAWFGWRVFRGYRAASPDRFGHAHHVPHLIMSGAMVYMLVAVSRSGPGSDIAGPAIAMGGSAGGTARFPIAALVLALFMIGYVMWIADRLPALATVRAMVRATVRANLAVPELAAGMPATAAGQASPQIVPHASGAAGEVPAGRAVGGLSAPLSRRLAACCEIALGITMGYMLILMV